ncbi:MAG: hypothetical protein K6G10_12245 [Butyrivibrio sp.]|nr:hypothetical protein [Butyrivibrio sp.]
MAKTALVIIFNHRFEQNLPALRKIYGDKFSELVFLMPFYTGSDPDVIPVYESSFCFNGFVTQARERLSKIDADFFLFVADDMLIDPAIDEWNAAKKLGIEEKEVYHTKIENLNSPGFYGWVWTRYIHNYFQVSGTNWQTELMSREEAFSRFDDYFGPVPRQWRGDLFDGCPVSEEEKRSFAYGNQGSPDVVYPLARGYSDIFAIKKDRLNDIAHVLGIMAAMQFFVEIAIPTAFVLCVDKEKIGTEETSEYQYSLPLWTVDEIQYLEESCGRNVTDLQSAFPENCLYIHPIKLSKWTL